ncbi:MAG: signal peptidase I [Anaerolineae bacterium]|nr:signal peptidase I [Thermoflexales bacterium]MDW8396093.1 signal peptidase I [Anaerolineae bacterium]
MDTPATPEAPTAAPTAQQARGVGRGALREIVETIALFAIVFVLARTMVGNYSILGQSMEPNYHENQRLLVDKITPYLFGYNRGDIVIARSPIQDVELIKRLIGKPGDTVEIRGSQVFVNGQPLHEPYLPPDVTTEPTRAVSYWILGKDEYFLLGDNRMFSQDSRAFGPVNASHLVGRAWLLYWPLSDLRIVEHYPHNADKPREP